MLQKLTSSITILHLTLLSIFCVDLILSTCTLYEFERIFKHVINLLLVTTGIFLLFRIPKGEFLFNYYLFIYPFCFFGLIFFIMISGGFASYLTPKHYLAKKNEITITELKGFLAPCCIANVYEQKFLVFQKTLGQVELPYFVEESHQIQISKKDNQVVITFIGEDDPDLIKVIDF